MKLLRPQRLHTLASPSAQWLAITLLSALALLAGCARIPDKELTAYIASVGEAKQAGQTMLTDWRSAREESDRRTAPPAPVPAGPIPLELPAPGGNALSPEDYRLQAWEAIGLYSETIARLNSGESVKKVTGRLLQLAVSIGGSAVPGLSELGTLLEEAAAAMERARLAAEFKKAVHKGAPVVRRIIREVFLPDTGDHYTLRATLANEDYASIEIDDQADDDQKRVRRARILDENKAFANAIVAYRGLLEQTDRSLETLEEAVDRPVDLADEAERLLGIATELKRYWLAYEGARREGRN